MPLKNSRFQNTQGSSSNISNSSDVIIGYVYDVILDEDNKSISSLDRKDEASIYVGAIRFRSQGNLNSSEDKLDIAYPDLSVKTIPTRNEVVKITKNPSGAFVYERTGFSVSPNVNAQEDTISVSFGKKESDTPNSKDYSTTSRTNIPRSSQNESLNTDGFGDYFEANDGIHKLKLYEGDTLIESRFGQSLRFSAYNNVNNEFSPTIILRNGENPQTIGTDDVLDTTVEESINNDDSIIVLGSNQYQLAFQPGTVDDNGNSDFETKPDSFKNYPSDLLGNQILLNSGRIILSAKDSEMIFYSKKNYGFISDGSMSIDNKFGIDINVGDNINITAEDRDVNINTSNGKINLGNQSLEPIVKGDSLVSILEELVDAIVNQQYLTPSGPTATGPTNRPTFQNIKSKLNTILSQLNSTS